jgi:hypothetical protein
MPKSTKARSAPSVARAAKASQATPGGRIGQKADSPSKQSRVIALLQSPTGATVAAMMKATGCSSRTPCAASWPAWCASA